MNITITLKEKDVASVFGEVIEHRLHSNFSNESLKKAGVPNVKELTETLLNDSKFMKKLMKQVTDFLNDEACNALLNELYDADIPVIDKYSDLADKVETNDKEVKAITKATAFLKSKGYDIKKTKG